MLSQAARNAVEKAIQIGTAASVERVQFGVYLVPSATTDEKYVVTAKGSDYRCTCPAGQHGKPCHHAAGVLIAKVEHASHARVVGAAS